jgi:hypothetical protein
MTCRISPPRASTSTPTPTPRAAVVAARGVAREVNAAVVAPRRPRASKLVVVVARSRRKRASSRVVVVAAADASEDDAAETREKAPDALSDASAKERIDRENLDERYYRGFLESGLSEADDADVNVPGGRETLSASMRFAAQAAAVLVMLTAGFMYSNGLLGGGN